MKRHKVGPGTAFWLVTDRGFGLGLMTHEHVRLGALVWLADRFWDEPPTMEDVATTGWRWCVFFPLKAAANRNLVEILGTVAIPVDLQSFPIMRQGGIRGMNPNWYVFENGDLDTRVRLATESDRYLNIPYLVNDTALKENLVKGWEPADRW